MFKLSVLCLAHKVGGTMWKFWLHVALLCAKFVVMTRCAIEVVLCMHGHLDMLMGNHGVMEGVDFWYRCCAWCISCI